MIMPNEAWMSIKDLSEDISELKDQELPSLASVWQEQADSLKDSEATKEFNVRLRREWAIETGIIERLYDIDRRITQLLIEQGLNSSLIPHGTTDKDPVEVMNMVNDHHEAIEGIFDFVSNRRDLSISYIKELHACITQHQRTVTAIDKFGNEIEIELLHGTWKQLLNNPTRPDGKLHTYCPPEHVQMEMENLIACHKKHEDNNVPPEVSAAWLHHRFTQIHPFQDGNGSVARALASLVFLRAQWFPLLVRRDDREVYIRALESADKGDLKPLIDTFCKMQKRAFVNALGLSREVLKDAAGIAEIIDSARDAILERRREHHIALRKVYEFSKNLEKFALERLNEIKEMLDEKFEDLSGTLNVFVVKADNDDRHSCYFRHEIVKVAKEFDYFANTKDYGSWIRMGIKTDTETNIFLSFHTLGYKFNGILVCAGMTFGRDPDSDRSEKAYPLGSEPFQFNYRDHEEALKVRFDQWLDEIIKQGLNKWRLTV